MLLYADTIPSPIGQIHVIFADDVLRALDFDDHNPRMHALLGRHYPGYQIKRSPAPRHVRESIINYFEGSITAIDDVPVETRGTPFQQEVWAALRRIPAGETTSYGQLAASIGRPQAMRAVGLANGSNPVGIVVPCHRVIGANGSLTGYGGGLGRKRWLLAHERNVRAPFE